MGKYKMNTDEVSSLKREWNLIMEEGRPMLDRLKFLGRRALEIQTIMIDEDPDLAFSMMFGYDIEEEEATSYAGNNVQLNAAPPSGDYHQHANPDGGARGLSEG